MYAIRSYYAHAATGTVRADASAFRGASERMREGKAAPDLNPAAMVEQLQATMQDDVGPFRTAASLERACRRLRTLRADLADAKPAAGRAYDSALADWHDP